MPTPFNTPSLLQSLINAQPWENVIGAIDGDDIEGLFQEIQTILAGMGTWDPLSGLYLPSYFAGTPVALYRQAGNDLQMLNAATAAAINANACVLNLGPLNLDISLLGRWWVNVGQSASGGPVQGAGIRIFGNSVGDVFGTAGARIKGDIWIGCGPNCVINGNKVDLSTLFISRAAIIENFFTDGSVAACNLQKNSRFSSVQVRPSSMLTRPNGQPMPGWYLYGCNTVTLIDCRGDNSIQDANGTPLRDNIIIDTCQDLRIPNGTFNTGLTGIRFVKEYDYTLRDSSGNPILDGNGKRQSTNPDGFFGSSRTVGATVWLHLEQNYGIAFDGRNLGAGSGYVRIIQQAKTDFTQVRALLGDDSANSTSGDDDGSSSSVNFKLCGNINGGSYAAAAIAAAVAAGLPAHSVAVLVRCNFIGFPTAEAGLRLQNGSVGVQLTSNCQRPAILPGVSFDASVQIPVQTVAPAAGSVTSLTAAGTTVTATIASTYGFSAGVAVTIAGANEVAYNGTFLIGAVLSPTQFTYNVISTPSAATATGTITYSAPSVLLQTTQTSFPALMYTGFQIAAVNAPANSGYTFDLYSDDQGSRITQRRFSNDSNGPGASCVSYRGSPAAPQAVQSGDNLALLTYSGYDGAATQLAASRRINVIGTIVSGATPAMPGQEVLSLSKPGTASPSNIQQIDWTAGRKTFGRTLASESPNGGYGHQLYTRSTLPTPSANIGLSFKLAAGQYVSGHGAWVTAGNSAYTYDWDGTTYV